MNRSLAALLSFVVAAGSSVLISAPASARDVDCGNFSSQKAAQIFFLKAGGPSYDPNNLDSDGDGIACESNPAPYYYGKTLPDSGGSGGGDTKPEPKIVKSSVSLTVTPNKRISGETYKLIATVRPAISRKVTVQQRVDGRWKAFASGTTGSSGKVTGTLEAPRKTVVLRAVLAKVAKGSTTYTPATSSNRTLVVQQQQVDLRFVDSTVSEGDEARALIHATPVRKGRPVALQVLEGNRWRTVDQARVDRGGRAEIVLVPALGEASYRAVVLEHRGADEARSAVRALTSVDTTAPSAPYDLVATAGDSSVGLTWSQQPVTDLARYDVWVRTDGSAWSLATSTTDPAAQVSGLVNGVTYWFAVSSVDVHENSSPYSPETSATPTAPVTSGTAAQRR